MVEDSCRSFFANLVALLFSIVFRCQSCYIGSHGAIILAPALGRNARLRELLIDFNEIGDKGVLSISDALSSNSNLEKLGLNGNQIGDITRLATWIGRTSLQNT